MTSVKEISGTSDFLTLAKSNNLCQNQETVQECFRRRFSRLLINKCRCLPYELYNVLPLNKHVRYLDKSTVITITHFIITLQAQLPICNPPGRKCAKEAKSNSSCSEMLKPCTGFYADVTQYKEDAVLTRETEEVKKMMEEYDKYKKTFQWEDESEKNTEEPYGAPPPASAQGSYVDIPGELTHKYSFTLKNYLNQRPGIG